MNNQPAISVGFLLYKNFISIKEITTMNNSKTKIIAVANQKGDVAKTTSVINIGAGLALKGKKVLLVDTDNQSHLSRFLGYDGTDGKPTISELIWQTVSKVQKPLSEAIRKSELGVDYIPCNFFACRNYLYSRNRQRQHRCFQPSFL